jgi:lipoprotein-anchoring transpeptidase ErfK/SrfK
MMSISNTVRERRDHSALGRRAFLGGGAASLLALAGCTTGMSTAQFNAETNPLYRSPLDRGAGIPPSVSPFASMYAPMPQEQFPLPAIPVERMDPVYLRQLVQDPTGERPGTIVVDTNNHFLYLTREDGQAMRYGVGLGREGFAWQGRAVVQYKRAWPRWTPPDEMVARQPELEPYSIANGGMDPGLDNPLGARALYIFQNGVDTIYRIHGSPEWWTIGKSVSSGCVRMLNQDVIDLHDRVPNGTPILVTGSLPRMVAPTVA